MAIALATNVLTTLAVAKDALGIAALDTSQDDLVTRLINSESQSLENACGRKFYLASLAESVPGYGTDKLRIAQPPIVSVSGITFKASALDITDIYLDNNAGLIQQRGGWNWTAHHLGGLSALPLPGTELPDYIVSYIGGWITPEQDGDAAAPVSGGSRNLPYDIEETCLDLIRAQYAYRQRDPNVRAESLRTWSVTYTGDKKADLANIAQDVVRHYKRLL